MGAAITSKAEKEDTKQMLYGQLTEELTEGQCPQGGQEKAYKDNIKTHLRKHRFNLNNWQEVMS